MGIVREEDRALESLVRWLIGAKPKTSSTYYFMKYRFPAETWEKLRELRRIVLEERRCPFCGRRIARLSCMAYHLLYFHRYELLECLDGSEIEKRVVELYKAGWGIHRIAKALGISKHAVSRIVIERKNGVENEG